MIYTKESASRAVPEVLGICKNEDRYVRRHRGTNKARYRRQMSKAKLGFDRARLCVYVYDMAGRFASEFHINFNAPESLAQSTAIGNIASSTYLRDQ